jgi:hypothetical protein
MHRNDSTIANEQTGYFRVMYTVECATLRNSPAYLLLRLALTDFAAKPFVYRCSFFNPFWALKNATESGSVSTTRCVVEGGRRRRV